MSVRDLLSKSHPHCNHFCQVSLLTPHPLVEESFKLLLHLPFLSGEPSHFLKGVRDVAKEEEVLHVAEPDTALGLHLCSQRDVSLLHPLAHQADHLLSAGEPRVPEGKVDCMDQAVVEEALLWRQAVVNEGSVLGLLLWLEDLVMEALAVVKPSAERSGLLLFELFQVSLLGGLVVCSDQAGIPEVLFRDVKLSPNLSVTVAQVAKQSYSLNCCQVASYARDSYPRSFAGKFDGFRGYHEYKQVKPDLLLVLPFERSFLEAGPEISLKVFSELFPCLYHSLLIHTGLRRRLF
jgi:hypothetical protein